MVSDVRFIRRLGPESWERHGNGELNDQDVSERHRDGRALRNRKYRTVVGDARKKKKLFTPEIKKFLKDWLIRRRKNPYPNRTEKKELAIKTGLTYMQICNWFANWRRKLKKSTVEAAGATGGAAEADTWGRLITGYNRRAQGNCEQFSISSHDSIWDEGNYNLHCHSDSFPRSSEVSRTLPNNEKGNVQNSTEGLSHHYPPKRDVFESAERPATSALVKWLESAARFRPRESCWGPSLVGSWGYCPSPSSPTRRPRRHQTTKKTKKRHREELDAAEALTFLSVSANVRRQAQCV